MRLPRNIYFQERVDPFVQAFLASDALLYSALNIVTVFFAVYTSSQVTGGSLGVATCALSLGYCARIFAELAAGPYISRRTETVKVILIILGMLLISLAYGALALTHHAAWLYIWWAIGGIGWGLALPTKLSVISARIDRTQSNQEWALNDALNVALIAVTIAVCGALATSVGIRPLLLVAALVNTIGTVPYIFFVKAGKRTSQAKLAPQPATIA